MLLGVAGDARLGTKAETRLCPPPAPANRNERYSIPIDARQMNVLRTQVGSAAGRDPSPIGRLLSRKKIGRFVFVHHDYPALAASARHSHPWLHLTMVGRGQYRRSVGRRTADLQAGSLSLLQTNDSHADSYAPGSACLHVVIPPEVEETLARRVGVRGRTGQLAPTLSARFFTALQREFARTDSESPLIVEALLLDLISRYLDVIRERTSARPRWLGLLLNYLDDSFEKRWSLETMSAEMGVQPVYLCRTFSEHLGCTLGEYIRLQRVMRGRQLLAIGADTLAQIAGQAGFCDQSHFTRAFKNHFGITPGHWRRKRIGSPGKRRAD